MKITDDEDESPFFVCSYCGKRALRTQYEIAPDCGELIYEDAMCMACKKGEDLQITPEQLLALPVKGEPN